jgi:hypothetical protein
VKFEKEIIFSVLTVSKNLFLKKDTEREKGTQQCTMVMESCTATHIRSRKKGFIHGLPTTGGIALCAEVMLPD